MTSVWPVDRNIPATDTSTTLSPASLMFVYLPVIRQVENGEEGEEDGGKEGGMEDGEKEWGVGEEGGGEGVR